MFKRNGKSQSDQQKDQQVTSNLLEKAITCLNYPLKTRSAQKPAQYLGC